MNQKGKKGVGGRRGRDGVGEWAFQGRERAGANCHHILSLLLYQKALLRATQICASDWGGADLSRPNQAARAGHGVRKLIFLYPEEISRLPPWPDGIQQQLFWLHWTAGWTAPIGLGCKAVNNLYPFKPAQAFCSSSETIFWVPLPPKPKQVVTKRDSF